MAIINPVSPVLTTQQAQTKLANATKAASNALFKQMVKVYHDQYNGIWSNTDGLNPQQAFDAFTTDAVTLCNLAEALVTAVNAAVPGTLSGTIPLPLTPNSNGSVTVGSAPTAKK